MLPPTYMTEERSTAKNSKTSVGPESWICAGMSLALASITDNAMYGGV